ncbi:hypothetical protein ACFQY7_10565 [Actinomadura luteofluorescens]|uniref:hypothetical protein n=1 Tax=Actinomadura luteofluorescens TaxID=46163 RepID=UPI00363EF6DE
MLAAERDRAAGILEPGALDEAVTRSREAFARLLGVPADRVACGPQVSYFTGLVAASLPAAPRSSSPTATSPRCCSRSPPART